MTVKAHGSAFVPDNGPAPGTEDFHAGLRPLVMAAPAWQTAPRHEP